MNYDIESKLNMIQTAPMTETEKSALWRKIELKINEGTTFGAFRFRLRAGMAFLLALIFAGSGVAFAYADTAKPGDILFPLGVAREKVEIFLAPQSKKNELRVKFAEKRIEDGQVFLSLLVNAKGTLATTFASSTATSTTSGTTSATTTATTTPPATTATSTATTTPNSATEDATRHFNATIAYLQEVRAELLKNGDGAAANALQRAIDAMVAQAHEAPTDRSSVLVKIKNNANKFKLDIRIANSTTTERIAFEEKNKERGNGKKNHRENDDNNSRNGTTTAIVRETLITKFFHKEEKKKSDREDGDNHGRNHGNKHDEDNDDDDKDDDEDHDGGFFDRHGKKATVCHIADGRRKTISIGKNAVRAHLAHGDTLGKCGTDSNATTTPPDTTAPALSNIISHPTATTAEVSWDTNENASYKFWYGTTTLFVLTGTPDKTGGASAHQTVLLTGLLSDTTYRFVIAATDASGNTSTSTEQSFKTAIIPDTTAPIISALSASAITAGSATVSWTTNEPATGKVKYATTSPLSNVFENTALTLTHSFNLTGLTASSTYHYIVSSADGAGNAMSSGELTFATY